MSERGLNPEFNLAEQIRDDALIIYEYDVPISVHAANEAAREMTHDDLTGLLRPKAWRNNLVERLQEDGDKAVLFVDLTYFKEFQDNSPELHEAGNRILKEVGNVLSGLFRSEDAGRYGGDEFAIYLDLTARSEEWIGKEPVERMNAVIDRVRDEFRKMKELSPELTGTRFDVAIGGAVWTPGMDSSTLLQNADQSMKQDKAAQHAATGSYR